MIKLIVTIVLFSVLVVALRAKKSKKKINLNGICHTKCEDCAESSWCVVRYNTK